MSELDRITPGQPDAVDIELRAILDAADNQKRQQEEAARKNARRTKWRDRMYWTAIIGPLVAAPILGGFLGVRVHNDKEREIAAREADAKQSESKLGGVKAQQKQLTVTLGSMCVNSIEMLTRGEPTTKDVFESTAITIMHETPGVCGENLLEVMQAVEDVKDAPKAVAAQQHALQEAHQAVEHAKEDQIPLVGEMLLQATFAEMAAFSIGAAYMFVTSLRSDI